MMKMQLSEIARVSGVDEHPDHNGMRLVSPVSSRIAATNAGFLFVPNQGQRDGHQLLTGYSGWRGCKC